jgi:hypothetical protein
MLALTASLLPAPQLSRRALSPRRASTARFACSASAAMSDPEGWDPVADTVGAGIYSGRVKRDASGAVLYGQQYAGHNPRPGPVYAGGGYAEMVQAIQRGPDAVAALLQAGGDANEEMTGGAKPLHTCGMSRRGQASVRVLLAAGAQVDALDTYGYTPLHRMASNDLADGARALIVAGADVNALTGFSDQTPLFIARFSGAGDVAQVLLDAGGREY